MVGFAAAAGAGDFGFPVGGFLVESAEGLSALRDGGPGFVGARNIGHEAAGGERDLAALRGLSLGHSETAGDGLQIRNGRRTDGRWHTGDRQHLL